MIEKNKLIEALNQTIFAMVAYDYAKSENANALICYRLGLLSTILPSIENICLLYLRDNNNDSSDIVSFHNSYLRTGILSYTGTDANKMAQEILYVKNFLIKNELEKNKDNIYESTVF